MSKIIDFFVIAVNYCLCLSKEKRKKCLKRKDLKSVFFLMILAVHYRICIIMKMKAVELGKSIKAIIFLKKGRHTSINIFQSQN